MSRHCLEELHRHYQEWILILAEAKSKVRFVFVRVHIAFHLTNLHV